MNLIKKISIAFVICCFFACPVAHAEQTDIFTPVIEEPSSIEDEKEIQLEKSFESSEPKKTEKEKDLSVITQSNNQVNSSDSESIGIILSDIRVILLGILFGISFCVGGFVAVGTMKGYFG